MPDAPAYDWVVTVNKEVPMLMRTPKSKPAERIAIVGLRYGQQHHVARQCKELANISFVDADKAEISFPEADAVILLTKFIQHRWTEGAYRVFPRERVHLHSGGISNLVRRIKRIASGNKNVERIRT
jgi:hypothetical protein